MQKKGGDAAVQAKKLKPAQEEDEVYNPQTNKVHIWLKNRSACYTIQLMFLNHLLFQSLKKLQKQQQKDKRKEERAQRRSLADGAHDDDEEEEVDPNAYDFKANFVELA